MAETTALGAAIAAGTCLNVWKAEETHSATMETFKPLITDSGIVAPVISKELQLLNNILLIPNK